MGIGTQYLSFLRISITGSEIQWSTESKIIAQSCFLSKALRHISMAAQWTYSKLMILCKFPPPCSIFILTFNYIDNLLSGTINQQWGNGVLFLFLYNRPVALGRILNEIRNTKYFRFAESYKKVHKVQQYSAPPLLAGLQWALLLLASLHRTFASFIFVLTSFCFFYLCINQLLLLLSLYQLTLIIKLL